MLYLRGFMYFLVLDAKIQAKSKGTRSVDDLVLELERRRKNNEPWDLGAWTGMVRDELGQDGLDVHAAMIAGDLLRPAANALGPQFEIFRKDKHALDPGFQTSSFGKNMVTGLKDGSNAAKAGLRENDQILDASVHYHALYEEQARMWFEVKSIGEDKTRRVEWWPRTDEVREAWEVRAV
jgi:predicted metalloprotease with PDZ domain